MAVGTGGGGAWAAHSGWPTCSAGPRYTRPAGAGGAQACCADGVQQPGMHSH